MTEKMLFYVADALKDLRFYQFGHEFGDDMKKDGYLRLRFAC